MKSEYDNRENDELYLQIRDILKNNPDAGRRELARITGAGEKPCRTRIKWFFREINNDCPPPADILKALSKAKTSTQLELFYGENWKAVINRPIPGFALFEDRNDYNEPVFILLPEAHDPVKVKPKPWDFYVGKDSQGVPDPCLTIQFPDQCFTNNEILVVPLFDVHMGHHAHRAEKFMSYLNWINQNDNVFAVIGGDLLENALDDGRGMTYDSSNPETQLDEAISKLSIIAHKILVAIPGNHEWRTYKRAGIDPTKIICDRLKIPYFSGPVFMRVLGASRFWNFYISHGKGNSQTKGGKLNAAQRPHKFIGMIHFNLSGHVHDPIVNPETVMTYDAENCCLKLQTRWTVIAPSFLGWKETYAYRAGYAPPGRGGVACHLYSDGGYKATMT